MSAAAPRQQRADACAPAHFSLRAPNRGSGPSPFADGPLRWVSARRCLSSCHPVCSREVRPVALADPQSTQAGVAAAVPQDELASVAVQATPAERPSLVAPPLAVRRSVAGALLRAVGVGLRCRVARSLHAGLAIARMESPEQPEEPGPLWPVQRPVAVAALLRFECAGSPCRVARPLRAAPAIAQVVRVEQLVEQAPPGSECHFAAVAALRPAVLADSPCQVVRA